MSEPLPLEFRSIRRSWEDRGFQQAVIDFEECLKEPALLRRLNLGDMPLRNTSCHLWSHVWKTERAQRLAEKRVRDGYDQAWEALLRVRELLASKDS